VRARGQSSFGVRFCDVAYFNTPGGFGNTGRAPDSLCIPLVHLNATFTLPSLHPPYLGRHQNGSQRTVTRTRQPSPEPDDRRQNQMTVDRDDNHSNDQPANTTNDSIDRSNRTRASIPARHRVESDQGLIRLTPPLN